MMYSCLGPSHDTSRLTFCIGITISCSIAFIPLNSWMISSYIISSSTYVNKHPLWTWENFHNLRMSPFQITYIGGEPFSLICLILWCKKNFSSCSLGAIISISSILRIQQHRTFEETLAQAKLIEKPKIQDGEIKLRKKEKNNSKKKKNGSNPNTSF